MLTSRGEGKKKKKTETVTFQNSLEKLISLPKFMCWKGIESHFSEYIFNY